MKKDTSTGFFSTNSQWLQPLLGTLLLMAVTFVWESLRSDPAFAGLPTIPRWLTIVAGTVGIALSAVFAFFTNTLAAQIYLGVLSALATVCTCLVAIQLIFPLIGN